MITNLNLNPKTEALFTNLAKNTDVSRDKLISTTVNHAFNDEISEEMEDLALLAVMTDMKRNNPNAKTYTHEEVKVMLGF